MYRASLSAHVEAVNLAHLACHRFQEHARPMLEHLIGRVVRRQDGRPGKVAIAALIPSIRHACDVGDVSVYFVEARTALWVEVHARANTPPVGCIYHRAAFCAGDVDDSGRLTKASPVPTHLRCNWTVEEVERLLDARRAAEERAREARAALGPFQDYRY